MHQCNSKEEEFMFFCFFYSLHYFKAAAFLKAELVIMLPLMYPVIFVRLDLANSSKQLLFPKAAITADGIADHWINEQKFLDMT